MAFVNDSKPTLGNTSTLLGGSPIGLLLTLTYAADVPGAGYTNDSKPAADSYSFDTKPS